MTLRIGVIGAGHLGRFHAKLVGELPEVKLAGVADPVREAAERVAAECGTAAYLDYHELLSQIDAAIVATPTRFHHAVGTDLLRNGIHVLMEKPLAIAAAEADDLVALAAERRLVLQVGHIERFNPAMDQAIEFIDEPRYIEAARYSGYTFRSTDIGVVLDLMIHDLDLAMTLARSPVERVEAIGMTVMGGHEDVAQCRLVFANGCVANLSASRVSYKPLRQMQVWSRKGHVSVDFATRSAVVAQPIPSLFDGRFQADQLAAEEQTRLKDRIFEELIPLRRLEAAAQNALLEEQRDFVRAIRTGGQPRVTGRQGRDVVAVAEQILDSIAISARRWAEPGADQGAADAPSILRGPHWRRSPSPAPRDLKRPA